MGKYIANDDVKIRLKGKVRFTTDPEDENKMGEDLLTRLVVEAEAHVEHDLSQRYAAPFVTKDDGTFKTLPDLTRNYIRTMCELQAVLRVLETDFGAGSEVDAEKYSRTQEKRYEKMRAKLMERKQFKGDDSGWLYPPLPELKFNYMNTETDDGYYGQVLSTSSGDGGFPADRINDPSESFINADVVNPLSGKI